MTDDVEEALLRRLYESTVTDGLTGAYNRKHFGERLAGEVAYARRHDTPLSLLMLDIDHFKKVNDTYGHPAGDRVLRSFTDTLRHTLRAEDVLARYGGEEFVIIARGLDTEHAMHLGERIRTLVAETPIDVEGHTVELTVSIGVASLACEGANAADGLVAVADRRLYAAKAAGRNRCIGG
jgi:diguanylate cyclase (GGDEF)-like protein